MMRARRVWLVAATAAILIQPGWTRAAAPPNITMVGTSRRAPSGPVERWFLAIPGGDDDRLVALVDALSAAGASHLQAFLPDLIVCDLPLDVDPGAIASEHGSVVTRSAGASRLEGLGLSVSPAAIERVHTQGRRALRWPESMPPPVESLADGAISEVSRTPEADMWKSAARATSGDSRLIHQGSEILAGRILIHVVLPESDYGESLEQYENWTGDAIAQIQLGLYYTLLNYQDYFPNAQIEAIYKFHTRVLIKAEPIQLPATSRNFWITLTLNALGYSVSDGDIPGAVHALNEEARARVGADWAFTMFLASAAKAHDHVFPGARTLSFTRVGGPYFVSSYPAGHLDEAWGMSLLTEHEIGHMFWGVEEDVGPASTCETRSGYLDEENANKVMEWVFIMGAWARNGCQSGTVPVPCIMVEFDQFAINSGYATPCRFTAGMMGVSDANENDIPDAFDLPPRIEFDSADIDTVTALPDYLGVRVTAQAVPNRNPSQPPALRRNYAARIRSIDVSVSGLKTYTLLPENIASNGYEAEFHVDLPPPLPGLLRVNVSARNSYEAQSAPRVKTYLYVGLAYLGFRVEHPCEGVAIRWMMLGDTFGARMTVIRRELATGHEVVVADGVQPVGASDDGVTPYAMVDSSVVVGARYEYRVHGVIDLPYRGGFLHKEVDSRPLRVQAAVPRSRVPDSPISNPSPNPFREQTWISVSIPHVDEFDGGDPQDAHFDESLSTPVSITVYDVLGRPVSRLYNRHVIGSALTLSWDGCDDRGTPLPSGVYFMRVAVGATYEVRKVLLVR